MKKIIQSLFSVVCSIAAAFVLFTPTWGGTPEVLTVHPDQTLQTME